LEDGSLSYNKRHDQSGFNYCCTAMWKADGKTTTLLVFLDSFFPKTKTNVRCFPWKQNSPEVNYSLIQISGVGNVSR
jgi:hypothetical protein